MPIILPTIADPSENIMAGEQFHLLPVNTINTTLFPDSPMILENPIEQMYGNPVPRQIESWSEQWGWTNKLTKLGGSNGGDLNNVLMGIQPMDFSFATANANYLAINPIPLQGIPPKLMNVDTNTSPTLLDQQIDFTQQFLMTYLPKDIDGDLTDRDVDMPGAPEASSADDFEYVTAASLDVALTDVTLPLGVISPRAEILLSKGGNNYWWGETLPVNIGRHMMKTYRQTTIKLLITGITKDSTGMSIGNCVVYVFRTDKFVFNNDPNSNCFVTSTISDGNGNFSVQVQGNTPYQLTAYLVGNPDVAGITVNSVVPIAG